MKKGRGEPNDLLLMNTVTTKGKTPGKTPGKTGFSQI
jgi:hypothetical protein